MALPIPLEDSIFQRGKTRFSGVEFMSLSLIAVLGVPLFLLPLSTHHIYEQVYDRERAAIAVDNGAILMGREFRSLLNRWRWVETQVKRWEVIHHPVHLCASIPSPIQPACEAKDRALELALEGFLTGWEMHSALLWAAAP